MQRCFLYSGEGNGVAPPHTVLHTSSSTLDHRWSGLIQLPRAIPNPRDPGGQRAGCVASSRRCGRGRSQLSGAVPAENPFMNQPSAGASVCRRTSHGVCLQPAGPLSVSRSVVRSFAAARAVWRGTLSCVYRAINHDIRPRRSVTGDDCRLGHDLHRVPLTWRPGVTDRRLTRPRPCLLPVRRPRLQRWRIDENLGVAGSCRLAL